MFCIAVVANQHVSAAESSVVATTTFMSSITHPYQRKSFYASGRFWVFYMTGSTAYYESTTNPTDWSGSAVSVGSVADGPSISVWFNGTHVHYARFYSNILYYRCGVPAGDGSITWSANEQTVYSGGSSNYYNKPGIAVDANGYAWIGTVRYDGTNYRPNVFKNSKNDGTWTTDTGFPYQLSTSSSSNWRTQPVALTGGKVYVLYSYSGVNLYGRLWSGSSWGTQETVSSNSIQYGYSFCGVAEGDNVHVAYNRASTYEIRYRKRTYGVGWGTDTLVVASTEDTTAPSLSVDVESGTLYLFYTKTSTDHVYYVKCVGGTWDASPTDWLNESSDTINYGYLHTAWNEPYNGKIGFLFQTKNASPYNIKFALLEKVVTIGEFQADSTVYAQKYTLINATVNDVNGVESLVNATVELSGGVILKWHNATDTFSLYADPNNYCTLDPAGSFKTALNSTAYRLSWRALFGWNYTEGGVDVVLDNTKVYDAGGTYGVNSQDALFTFEDDLAVAAASVDKPRANPNDALTFNGTVYYEGTTTPPASGSSGLSFDGVDDYVKAPHSASLVSPTTGLTVTAWVKRSVLNTFNAIVSKDAWSAGFIFRIEGENTLMTMIWFTDETHTPELEALLINDLEWHHVAFTFDSATGKIIHYKDALTTATWTGYTGKIIKWDTGDLILSRCPDCFNGLIDEVRIYNRTLSLQEINSLYHGGNVNDSLVLYLPFDGDALDRSGCGNHGVNYGAAWSEGVFAGVEARVELNGTLKSVVYNVNATDGSFTFSPFTAESSLGDYAYNVYVCTDELGVSNKTVTVTVDTIGLTAETASVMFKGRGYFVNVTAQCAVGYGEIANVTLQMNEDISLLWNGQTNVFSELNDPHGYVTLDADNSFRTVLNSTACKVSFKLTFAMNMSSQYVTVNVTAFDTHAVHGFSANVNLFHAGDNIKVLGFSTPDGTCVQVGNYLRVRAVLIYEYSGYALTSGSVWIEGKPAVHISSGLWEVTFISLTPANSTVDDVAVFTPEDITDVNMNGQNVTLRWYLYFYDLTLYCMTDETTAEKSAANYTIFFEGMPVETYVVAAGENLTLNYTDTLIQYILVNSTRQYWLPKGGTFEVSPAYSEDLCGYVLTFTDYAGITKNYRVVQLETVINGTRFNLEMRMLDSKLKVQVFAIPGKMYDLKFVNLDTGSFIAYGTVLFGSETEISLTIQAVHITGESALLSPNVQINIYRDGAAIYVNYNDTLRMTTYVNVTVSYYNGTFIASAGYTDQEFVYTYVGSANESYKVEVAAKHLLYGTSSIHASKYLMAAAAENTWNLSWLGTSWGFDATQIIPAFITVFAAATVSVINAPLGAFLAVAVAAAMASMGWWSIPSGILVTAFAFAVMFAISYARRRMM